MSLFCCFSCNSACSINIHVDNDFGFEFCYQLEPLIVLLVCLLRELTALTLVLPTGLVVTVQEGSVVNTIYEHSIGTTFGCYHWIQGSWV